MKIYELIAEAFVKEGVRSHFTLMGDGNMHFVSMLAQAGVKIYHLRHEHCACGMAIGAFCATNDVATASVTSGPGITQIVTILATAAANRVPLVILAGETPIGSIWHTQQIDQAAIVKETGTRYISARSKTAIHDAVREAFYYARHQSMPVVVGVPYDLQIEDTEAKDYRSSLEFLPRRTKPQIDDGLVQEIADRLSKARSPILVAGRGAMSEEAKAQIERLAERSGALVATTLPARGLFRENPFSLGIIGGFASEAAREIYKQADLIVAFGASLAYFSVDGGLLFPNAEIVKIGFEPHGLQHGRRNADLLMYADSVDAAAAISERLCAKAATIRSQTLAERLRQPPDPTEFDIEEGFLDPREVVRRLDEVVPPDWDVISGTGHSSYFYSHMKNRFAGRFHVIREFGAIGNSLSIAMGVAAERGTGKVLLLDGDGGFLMHAQELEAIQRHGIKLLIGILNDGAYGAEIHKLQQMGLDHRNAVFGHVDFAKMAHGFGLRGENLNILSDLEELIENYEENSGAMIWNFMISARVISPRMIRQTKKLGI
jgi:acetolactate synthase-1/2/3 large subunit